MRVAIVSAACLMGLVFCSARADTPEETYRTVFGAEAAKVSASSNPKDQADFARKVLDSAEQSTSDHPLCAYLCEKVMEFAAKDFSGLQSAARAVKLACRAAPDKKSQFQETFLKVCEGVSQHARNDEEKVAAGSYYLDAILSAVDARIDSNQAEAAQLLSKAAAIGSPLGLPQMHLVTRRQEVLRGLQAADRDIAQAEASLKTGANAAATARRIMLLCLIEKDNPQKAAEYLEAAGKEEPFATYIPQAAKDAAEIGEEACLELASWYRDLAAQRGNLGRLNTLTRAKRYCDRVLAAHKQADPTVSKARLLKEQIVKDLFIVQAALSGGWIDLMELVDRGAWNLQPYIWQTTADGCLTTKDGAISRATISYQPPAEYDLEASFTRETGIGPAAFMCPFGETGFACILSDPNGKAGLATIKGVRIVEKRNPTVRNLPLVNGNLYSVLIQVRKKGIRVLLNQRPIIDYMTEGGDLRPDPSWNPLIPGAIGFGALQSRVAFHNIWLREVAGSGRFAASQPVN